MTPSSMPKIRDQAGLLTRALKKLDRLNDTERMAFEEMRGFVRRGKSMTIPQIRWVQRVVQRVEGTA